MARLRPVLLRLSEPASARLDHLARRTRIRKAGLLREAVTDLLAKYSVAGVDRTDVAVVAVRLPTRKEAPCSAS